MPRLLPLVLLAAVFVSLLPAYPAAAQIPPPPAAITVNTAMDLPANFSVTAPEYDDGNCSLREAVQTANTNQPINATNEAGDPDDDDQPDCVVGSGSGDVPDLIVFGSGVSQVTLQGDEIVINSHIAMLGPVAIDGARRDRIFRVATSNAMLDLSGMTLANGKDGGGGAILVEQGTLNVAGVAFLNNEATASGGAISNSGGKLRIAGATFIGNKAAADGGAISSTGPGRSMVVAAAAFEGNTAGGSGGAVHVTTSNGSAEISDSTFSANVARGGEAAGGGAVANNGVLTLIRASFAGNLSPDGRGGAVFSGSGKELAVRDSAFAANVAGSTPGLARQGGAISNLGGVVRVTGSSFVSNTASGLGGAIANDRGTLTLANSTVSSNLAAAGGGLANGNSQVGGSAVAQTTATHVTFGANAAPIGGSIFNEALSGTPHTVTVANSIIASTLGTCSGPIIAQGANLQHPGDSCGVAIPVAAPQIDLPSFNGGPLPVLMSQRLLPGSPALDAADAAICVAAPVEGRDGRAYQRPQDGDADGEARCDLGAFESERLAGAFSAMPMPPGPINLGSAVVGQATAPRDLAISNAGNAPLRIEAAQLGGVHGAEFSLTFATPFVLQPEQAGTIPLRCTPGAPGARSARLSLATNDPERATLQYDLTCTGTAAPAPAFGASPAAPRPPQRRRRPGRRERHDDALGARAGHGAAGGERCEHRRRERGRVHPQRARQLRRRRRGRARGPHRHLRAERARPAQRHPEPEHQRPRPAVAQLRPELPGRDAAAPVPRHAGAEHRG